MNDRTPIAMSYISKIESNSSKAFSWNIDTRKKTREYPKKKNQIKVGIKYLGFTIEEFSSTEVA